MLSLSSFCLSNNLLPSGLLQAPEGSERLFPSRVAADIMDGRNQRVARRHPALAGFGNKILSTPSAIKEFKALSVLKFFRWARKESNLPPLLYQRSVLPLNYVPYLKDFTKNKKTCKGLIIRIFRFLRVVPARE